MMRPDRPASIAAMGYRLAAAGPRTRQRLIERESVPARDSPPAPPPQNAPSSEKAGEEIRAAAPLVADSARWPSSHTPLPAAEPVVPRGVPTRARMIATLGVTAACGFGLVLASQSQFWKRPDAVLLAAVTKPTAHPAPSPEPPKPVEAAQPKLAAAEPPAADERPGTEAATLPQPQPARAQPAPAQAPSAAPVARPVLSPKKTILPHPTEKPVAPAQPVQLAHLSRPAKAAKLAMVHPALVHAATAPVKLAAAKPHAPEPRPTQHELPRWLTEDHPSPARGLLMSEPPHNLALPAPPHQEMASRKDIPAEMRMESAPPPPAERRMVIANTAGQVPLRPPGYRPFEGPVRAYYGPYYPPPAPYGQPYPQGW